MSEVEELIDRLFDGAYDCLELAKISVRAAGMLRSGFKVAGRQDWTAFATCIENINLNYNLIMPLLQEIDEQQEKEK